VCVCVYVCACVCAVVISVKPVCKGHALYDQTILVSVDRLSL
jgi:hypothetical protein